jgi:iron(III)-enterobactin esterase
MASAKHKNIISEQKKLHSTNLKRDVIVDVYYPATSASCDLSVLFINDGQDLPKMNFGNMLKKLTSSGQLSPVMVVGVYAGDRLSEYGTAGIPDFNNRGEKADLYQQFLLQELLVFINNNWPNFKIKTKAIAGFSLGALSALDTVLNNPGVFSIAGMFSGSFWWRRKDLDDGYDENNDRIIHQKVRNAVYHEGLRVYFTTGSLDETADRNNNGIIDSIDDTLALISELENIGYEQGRDISYINYEDGKHDVETWGKAMPAFLLWGWGKK